MIQLAGTLIFAIGILGLFALDRDRMVRTSNALWLPILWLFIAGSRPFSLWLNLNVIGSMPDDQLEGSPLDRNAFAFLIALAFIVLVGRRRKVFKLLRANVPILLFLSYCGLSIFWSDYSDVAFKRWIRAVGDMAMVLVVLTENNPFEAVKTTLARSAFITIPLSILYDLGRGYAGREYHVGLTLSNKNLYGAISMILGLAAVWRFLTILRSGERVGRSKRLLAHGTVALMGMWCIWTANSGTARACFLLGIVPIVVLSRLSLARRPVFVYLASAALVFVAFYVSILNPNMGIVSAMGKDPTLTGRTEVWTTVLKMIPSQAFGAGFESFWLGPRLKELWNIFVWHPNEAHNGYIELYLNLGWAGLSLLALIIITGFRSVVRTFCQDRVSGSLGLAYFIVVVVYSLTEAGFRIFSPTWILFLLTVAGGFRAKRKNGKAAPAPRLKTQVISEARFSHYGA